VHGEPVLAGSHSDRTAAQEPFGRRVAEAILTFGGADSERDGGDRLIVGASFFSSLASSSSKRLARFAQKDADHINAQDLALEKPDILRALLAPISSTFRKASASKAPRRAKPSARASLRQ
jgi:hypothetical protein